MKVNLPELTDVLDEIEFFERELTDRQFVELAILLYDCGVSLRKVKRVLGEDQRAHQRRERLDVAAVGEDRFERRQCSPKPRR